LTKDLNVSWSSAGVYFASLLRLCHVLGRTIGTLSVFKWALLNHLTLFKKLQYILREVLPQLLANSDDVANRI
jgi:hypothetical protein